MFVDIFSDIFFWGGNVVNNEKRARGCLGYTSGMGMKYYPIKPKHHKNGPIQAKKLFVFVVNPL